MAPAGAALCRSLLHGAHTYVSRRAMSRLFVGGLSFTTEEEGLRNAFGKFGEVIDARIVTDRESGRSRGFGFVTYLSEEHADMAKQKMSGQFLDGRVIRVDRATPRPLPPRLDPPPSDTPEQTAPQDWGSIPSPIAAVPQNAGLTEAASSSLPSPGTSDAPGFVSGLPDLSSLASPSNPIGSPAPPFSFTSPVDSSPPTRASTKDTGPSFDFIDLDLSNLPPPDPNRLARRRPPRIRPSSMADYEFGYYMSETSKFPFNTNFETGFQKPKGPEYEFDFTDIREAAAAKKAEELALKKAMEAEEAARAQMKEAEEVGLMQSKELEEATAGMKGLNDASSSQALSQEDMNPDASLRLEGAMQATAASSISQMPQDDGSNAADPSDASVQEARQSIAAEL